MVCGQIWEEVAHAPGVAEMSVKTGWSSGIIHLLVEGRLPAGLPAEGEAHEDALPDLGSGWSSSLTRAVVGHLTRTVTLSRSRDTIRIEADFPAAPIEPSSV